MLPHPDDVKYFLEVSDTLNISRAAERVGISQPSLSLAIQRLEAILGAPLLIRSRAGVRLTKAGQKLKSRGAALLADWEKLCQETSREDSEIGGRFTIGCHHAVALYGVVGALPELMREHPRLEIRLVHDLSRVITEQVISFKIDLGVVINPVAHPELVLKSLGTDEVAIWCTDPKNPLQDPYSGECVLAADPEMIQSQELQRRFAKAGLTFRRMIGSSNLEVIAAMVASGAAAGILPTRVAKHYKAYQLRRVSEDLPRYTDQIVLAYRADSMTNRAGKVIIRALERFFSK